jgi:excisionase family DNA binding protein
MNTDIDGDLIMADSLLTPERAAQLLAVRPKTIRDWLKRGRLKGVRAGRLWRIRERDLEVFLAAEKETQSWLDADTSVPLPPYDWGPSGPPKGYPVRYVSGVGLTIKKQSRG